MFSIQSRVICSKYVYKKKASKEPTAKREYVFDSMSTSLKAKQSPTQQTLLYWILLQVTGKV